MALKTPWVNQVFVEKWKNFNKNLIVCVNCSTFAPAKGTGLVTLSKSNKTYNYK